MKFNETTLALALLLSGAVLLPAHEQLTLTVGSTMDIFQAGGNIDNSGGGTPAAFTFAAQPSRSVLARGRPNHVILSPHGEADAS